MEEDNKVWLGLGEDQIDQSLFLTNAANNIQSYVQNKPWSNKRKQSFLNAYNAIMQTGVTGATNDTGQWELTTQTQLDPSGLSNRDQEMLGDAAYFILSQMQGVTPRETSTEESAKEKTKFVGATAFDNWVSNNIFGGREYSRIQDWNVLDERGSDGRRGVANRLSRMKDYLVKFRETLNDNDWDYTDNPTGKNAAEVQARIDTAINALNGKTEVDQDIIDSLNALGINYRDWFDNGLGEDSGKKDINGNPLTWQEWQEQQAADAETKAKENAAKLKAQNEAIKASPWSKTLIHKYSNPTWNANEFANQLGDRDLVSVLNDYASRMSSLNSGQRKFVHSAYRSGIPKVQISDEEYNILKNTSAFRNAPKSRFSKIAGVDGLIYDNSTQSLLSPLSMGGESSSVDPNEWIHSQSSKVLEDQTKNISAEKRKKYLASHKDGLTSAEWEELASIGFDIASIVDPEMISSAGLALTGSGLRHHAMKQQPGGPSTSDKWWQAADYGLSILGSIPVLGDAALGARAINNLKKAIVPLGVVMAGANVPQAAKAAYNKVVKGEDLTIQDWRAIGAVLTAAVGYGRGRQMSKRAEALRKTGGTTSKSTKEGVIKTSEGEIKVSESKAKQLKEKFGKNDGETRTKALREDVDVQKAAKEQKIDLSKAEVQGYGKFKKSPISSTTSTSNTSGNRVATLRAMSEFNKNHGWLARKGLAEQDWIFRKTGGYESAPQSSNWFKDAWNKLRHSDWDEFGTNKQNVSTNNPTVETPNPTKQTKLSFKERRDLLKSQDWQDYKQAMKDAKSSGNSRAYRERVFNRGALDAGEYSANIFGKDVKFKVGGNSKTRTLEITQDGETIKFDFSGKNGNREVRKAIANIIEKNRKASQSLASIKNREQYFKNIKSELLKLRQKGLLKQGGQINNFDLDTTISNFLKNQK